MLRSAWRWIVWKYEVYRLIFTGRALTVIGRILVLTGRSMKLTAYKLNSSQGRPQTLARCVHGMLIQAAVVAAIARLLLKESWPMVGAAICGWWIGGAAIGLRSHLHKHRHGRLRGWYILVSALVRLGLLTAAYWWVSGWTHQPFGILSIGLPVALVIAYHLLDARLQETKPAPVRDDPQEFAPQRVAEALLSHTLDAADYERVVKQVRSLGIDPETIPHAKPDQAS